MIHLAELLLDGGGRAVDESGRAVNTDPQSNSLPSVKVWCLRPGCDPNEVSIGQVNALRLACRCLCKPIVHRKTSLVVSHHM